MDTSTPNCGRRETPLIDMEDESPIGDNKSDQSSGSKYSPSADTINCTKARTGYSNELDTTVLSPFKEPSPNTMDRKLAIGARDLVVGVDGNIEELKGDVLTEVPLNDNSVRMIISVRMERWR